MVIHNIPFESVDWNDIHSERHNGETGYAEWKVRQCGSIRVRVVEYSPGYKADHWCSKGHIILCLEGEMYSELDDGRVVKLTKGMCYFVGDNNEAHRSTTATGCKLFIVD